MCIRDSYHSLRQELGAFNPEMLARPELIAMSKADLPDVREAYPELKAEFSKLGKDLRLISAATHEGTQDLMRELAEQLLL